MKKQNSKHKILNTKNNKGITLIALVITIVVLLILAMVSIRLITNEGILTKSEYAVNRYSEEELKEKIALAYSNYKMNKYAGSTDSLESALLSVGVTPKYILEDETGYEITVDTKNGEKTVLIEQDESIAIAAKTEDQNYLEEYFLGTDRKGLSADKFATEEGFTDSTITLIGGAEINTEDYYYYIKYNNKAYRITIDTETAETKDRVKFMYEPKGREGQTVTYSYDGTTENEKEWTILYDNGENVEIISPEVMGSLTLGYGDESAVGSDSDEKAIYSYNNVVNRMNSYCSTLITNENEKPISVRSAGSNPINPSSANTQMYTAIDTSGNKYTAKGTDFNSEQDLVRIAYWSITSYNESFWVPSRYIDEVEKSNGELHPRFFIRYMLVDSDMNMIILSKGSNQESSLFDIWISCDSHQHSKGVVPVVKIAK